MIAVIFGIQGSGKSSVVQEIIKKRPNFERFYWGGFSTDLAIKNGLVDNIDEIRALPVQVQKKLQLTALKEIQKIVEQNKDKNFIIETHAALKTLQGYMPGLTPEILNKLKPELFVVIETNAKDIYQRRINDTTRNRRHDKSIEEVQLNIDATRWFASNYTISSDATLMIVDNTEGNMEKAVDEIIASLDLYTK